MATTRSRPHGREHARSSAGGVAAEHATKIYAAAAGGIVIIVAFLALTSVGHVIDAATQHFMLFYAGVFALLALCASTGLGLVATDRVFLHAGHRVLAQSAHRAASFGAVTFLIIHIVTEILAQRVHVLDAVVPFLSPFRTFYIGLGTIASDLIILLVITGIMRGRFNAHGRAWRWRAIHYTSYASFVFGVWHGLLGGRPAKPYVDWSYGLLVALVLLALAVRIVSNSLRPKENLSGPPVPMSGDSASAPMRAAAMFAQLGAARANTGGQPRLMVSSVQEPALSAPVSGEYSGSPMLTAPLPAGTGELYYEPGYEGPPRYIGAPRAAASGPMPRATTGSQPRLPTGPFPRPGTGPMPRAGTGPMAAAGGTPSWPSSGHPSGPMPRAATGPFPSASAGPAGGPQSWPSFRPVSGPMPRATDPTPPSGNAPWAAYRPESDPMAAGGPMPGRATGSQPRTPAGPFPRPGTGPVPRAAFGPTDGGPRPRPTAGPGSGPMPRAATGPHAWPASGPASGPMPRAASGPQPRPASGPASGPIPRAATGPIPRSGSGSRPAPWPGPGPSAADGSARGRAAGAQPRTPTGPFPRPGTGPMPRAAAGPGQRGGGDPRPRSSSWPNPGPPDGPRLRAASGPMPQVGGTGPLEYYGPRGDYPSQSDYRSAAEYRTRPGSAGPGGRGEHGDRDPQPGRRGRPRPGRAGAADGGQAPWDGGLPEPDPALRYREPGPGMPGYRGSRDARYGGDRHR